MMVPFDGQGPQQGNPAVAPPPRGPMPPGHGGPPGPSPGGQMHHQNMHPPHFSRRESSGGMPGQPPFPIQPQSPASRHGNFNNMPPNGGQYSSHPPLHSPHQQQGGPPPILPHPSIPHPSQQLHRNNSMNRQQHGMGQQQMPPMPNQQQHEMRASNSQQQQQQQQQQQGNHSRQQYMGSSGGSGGMSGSWQSDKDTPHRREMIQHIVKLLKKDKGGSPPESINKLPQMAKQLEVSLYRNARSFEAYMDMATLKQRLQQIAVEVSKKARSQNDPPPREDRHFNERPPNFPSPTGGSMRAEPAGPGPGGPGGANSPFMGSQGSSGGGVGGGHMVNMDEINPMASGGDMMRQGNAPGYSGSHPSNNDQMGHQRNRPTSSNNSAAMSQASMSQASMPQNRNDPMSQNRSDPMAQNRSDPMAQNRSDPMAQNRSDPQHRNGGNDPMTAQNRNDPEWKIRVRHKQQRLLLLHHSAKCPHEGGRCPVTPHCTDMKRLWRHMEACKDNNCRVSHCFSSRAILSHYRKCKDTNCPACGPVRDTVRRSKGSTTRPSASTGPMMNEMRGVAPAAAPQAAPPPPPPQPPQQHQSRMPPSSDSFSQNGGSSHSMSSSGASSSFPPQRQPGHSTMPPPVSGHNGSSSAMPPYSSQQSQPPSHYRPSSNSGKGPPQASAQSHYSSEPPPPHKPVPPSSSARVSGNSAASQSLDFPPSRPGAAGAPPNKQNDSEWQKIRHKQQRLLLLRHASRCQHEAGKCPVTAHCASMKKLWEHIAHCRNQQCTVQHCLSSRYVLSHYRRCKDARCPACGPVRDTIRKSHEREQSRHEQSGSTDAPPSLDDDKLMGSRDDSFDVRPPSATSSRSSPTEIFSQDRKRAKTEHDLPPQSAPTIASAPPVQKVASKKIEAVKSAQAEPKKVASKAAASKTAASKTDGTKEKVNADLSLLNSFTVRELETHLASLDRKTQLPPTKLKSKCLEVLKGLQTHHHGWVFNCPVDPVELGLPDYFEIIKKPMDLGSIQKRLENGAYHAIEDFQSDVNLTFQNAMTYNEDGSVVYDMAKELMTRAEGDMKKLIVLLETEDRERRKNERACTLCGCEKLLFEPPVYFCNGMNCQSQRIRRNSHFYIGGNNQYFWCSTCYNELDEKIPIELLDMTISKTDLKKKKNDEIHEESWVQCDDCERWVHQICGLFNTRLNKEHQSEYCCPECLLQKKKKTPKAAPLPLPLPRPPGAADLPRTTLSEWLEQHLAKRIGAKKRQLAEDKAKAEGISLEEATRYVESGGPVIIRQVTSMERKLEVRELMQKRYAHKNYPEEFPFRCKSIVVFQQLDGVDVVLFALYVYEHGEDNPPPNKRCVYISYLDSVHFMRPRRLRTFVYHEILIAYLDYARRKGFATAHIWACPPLKGDDYIFYAKPEDQKTPKDSRLRQWYIEMLDECQKRSIVGTVTNMYDLYFADEKLDATAVPYLEGDYFPGEAENIIKMLEEGTSKKAKDAGKKKKSKASTKSKGSTGTRSTGVDEEALLASGLFEGARSLKDLDRDQVMVKLGDMIRPMKDSFIVAFLNWKGAREEDMVVPESVEKARIEYAASGDKDLAGSKRDALGSVRDAVGSSVLDKDGETIKVIDDDDEDLDCEFLNNRQAFLNLCRGNHYQFDELRRSKHTSMMVLWHLHNRDAPKFVQQCVACGREILSGKRYHCNSCPDYDLCQDCYKDPKANRGACSHTLVPIAVEPEAGKDRSGLTDEERLQRQRNLMLHIQLIEHASRCNSKSCTSTNCAKMKDYLQHARVCRIKVQGGCRICKRIWTLLRIHAQKCKDNNCPIPQCTAIREKMRQLQKQQQAMDDRRRLEMNRHMRGNQAGM